MVRVDLGLPGALLKPVTVGNYPHSIQYWLFFRCLRDPSHGVSWRGFSVKTSKPAAGVIEDTTTRRPAPASDACTYFGKAAKHGLINVEPHT